MAEIERLLNGPGSDDYSGDLGLETFIAICDSNAAEVLERVKSVLRVVFSYGADKWPPDESWRDLLPDWFVERCALEPSMDEVEAWLSKWGQLSPEEQERLEAERAWSVGEWIYWFQPGNRVWYWWDATVQSPAEILVTVLIRDWPFPWKSLQWLFLASGALDFRHQD